ncbi:hypothetical protein MSPP1_000651 [Malassezia sp. CBS 17886]|nr:hypothetical protein MSPP1_000651 [Malassezia sp. CBS 17886]
MEAVQQGIDGVRERMRAAGPSANAQTLGALIAMCEHLPLADSERPHVHETLLAALHRAHTEVNEANRQYYVALNKIWRAVDRQFTIPIDELIDQDLFGSAPCVEVLAQVVLDYLLRQGHTDVAAHFAQEAGIAFPAARAEKFATLRSLVQSADAGDVGPVMAWVLEHSDALGERGSALEYWLRRAQFLRIACGKTCVRDGLAALPRTDGATNVTRAFAFGRAHFGAFLGAHLLEIQCLLTHLLYLPAFRVDDDGVPLVQRPSDDVLLALMPPSYRVMLQTIHAEETQLGARLRADYCALGMLPQTDPLRTSVDVGANNALGRIIKVRNVMRQRGKAWTKADELPIEVPLPPQFRYHSQFLCPVSKELGSEENPPMMMPCGHVVCLDSLAHLARGGGRVKCPYCPVQSTMKQALRLYF